MSQHYSDSTRENDPHALPDVEVFYHSHSGGTPNVGDDACVEGDNGCSGTGWYWWACFPGCLPDGEPVGPFATEAEAIADAQDND